MKDLDAAEWEELARRDPYFRVLTHDGRASESFFETGEEDIAALLSAIALLRGRELPLSATLDFGCGVGRLTLPLARRSARVVACDVAPTMLTHARRNALDAGLHNITFIGTEELAGLSNGQFDFVCSLLVLQYIPPAIGREIIRTLLRLLAPAGIAALHVTFERRGGRMRRLAGALSARRDAARHAFTDIHEYPEHAVREEIAAAGAFVIGRFPTHHGNAAGAVLIIEKPA